MTCESIDKSPQHVIPLEQFRVKYRYLEDARKYDIVIIRDGDRRCCYVILDEHAIIADWTNTGKCILPFELKEIIVQFNLTVSDMEVFYADSCYKHCYHLPKHDLVTGERRACVDVLEIPHV